MTLAQMMIALTNKNGEMEKSIIVVKTDLSIAHITYNKKKPMLKELQQLVGGYIELVDVPYLEDQGEYMVVVNEEGLIRELPLNYHMQTLFGVQLYGNAIIMRKDFLE
jgi:hypothetical protein